jgi:hypothetical protein
MNVSLKERGTMKGVIILLRVSEQGRIKGTVCYEAALVTKHQANVAPGTGESGIPALPEQADMHRNMGDIAKECDISGSTDRTLGTHGHGFSLD